MDKQKSNVPAIKNASERSLFLNLVGNIFILRQSNFVSSTMFPQHANFSESRESQNVSALFFIVSLGFRGFRLEDMQYDDTSWLKNAKSEKKMMGNGGI